MTALPTGGKPAGSMGGFIAALVCACLFLSIVVVHVVEWPSGFPPILPHTATYLMGEQNATDLVNAQQKVDTVTETDVGIEAKPETKVDDQAHDASGKADDQAEAGSKDKGSDSDDEDLEEFVESQLADNQTNGAEDSKTDDKVQSDDTVTGDDDFGFSFEDYTKVLWKPVVTPTTPKFKPYNGFEFELPNVTHHFTEPLGERLCIIDMDNRPWDDPGYIFSDTAMAFDGEQEVQGQSLGILQHWTYAQIHGYKYYYVKIEDPPDRRSSWMKPPILSKIIEKHDVCIYLDGDALFHYPNLPMEWLMNFWAIDPAQHSVTLAHDPTLPKLTRPDKKLKDHHGNPWDNTGFLIVQNNPKTYEIMQDWWDCPSEGSKYPGCDHFRDKPTAAITDQGGWGVYIKYAFWDYIKGLTCSEANGYPGSGSDCLGVFITHVWTGKHTWLNQIIGEQMPGPWLTSLHKAFQKDKKNIYRYQDEFLDEGWEKIGGLGHVPPPPPSNQTAQATNSTTEKASAPTQGTEESKPSEPTQATKDSKPSEETSQLTNTTSDALDGHDRKL